MMASCRLSRDGVLLRVGRLLIVFVLRDCRATFVLHLRWRWRSKTWWIRNPFFRWDERKGGPRP